jgi:SAM-dependent methyltransferase
MDLAAFLPDATICAIDKHVPFVEETNRRAAALGVSDRVRAVQGDMRSLEFPPNSFDLIWCEGAAYIIGVERALRSWRSLLRPGGKLAMSEAIWLQPNPPPEIARCWSEDYPDMGDAESCKRSVRDCGYQLLGDFVLPAAAWWEYYTPMEQRLRLLAPKYAGDPFAESVLRESAEEIENYRNYGTYYGYLFMVMAPKA